LVNAQKPEDEMPCHEKKALACIDESEVAVCRNYATRIKIRAFLAGEIEHLSYVVLSKVTGLHPAGMFHPPSPSLTQYASGSEIHDLMMSQAVC